MLKRFKADLRTLTFVTRLLIYRTKSFILPLIFANYAQIRLSHLLDMRLRLKSIPDEFLQLALDAHFVSSDENYVDTYSCALANADLLKDSETRWYYVCSVSSLKKYKITLRPSSKVSDNELLLSETMKFNIQNHLNVSNFDSDGYFIIAATDLETGIAEEAELSLIKNPHDCMEEFINDLLSAYFSSARYLRVDDMLSVDIEKFSPHYRYLISLNNRKDILFKITRLKVDETSLNPRNGCFVVRGMTSLIQKPNIHDYSPRRYLISAPRSIDRDPSLEALETSEPFVGNCPPALEDSLKSLIACIRPFTQSESFVDVRPVFLIKGARGSGKSSLVRIAAQRMGLNLVNADLSEVQSLTSAQTEAKLRIVLHNAKNCVPSILLLSNIQVFGKDAEGKEDQRIISSFETELNNLCNPSVSKFPLLIVATANSDSTLPASLEQVFIETIRLDDLSHNLRFETLKWLLKTKGLDCDANDLAHVSTLCTDFVLADLNAIVLHATKIRISFSEPDDPKITTTRTTTTTLRREDFEKAHEYMQSRYSDWMGAPRVPKVRWEDIGGLAELKSEILRRIELPLMTSEDLGLRRSGLLLYGPPGTGKTLLAKAVATECQVHFLSVKGPELLNMYVGQSEKNVREVFARARASSPCVIFFDELDSLAPNRGRSGDSGGVMDRVVSQLLSEMDGLDSDSGSVFIIGATNRPDLIDPALLRPGRFDKLLYVGVSSDKKSQLGILRALTRKFELSKDGLTGLERLVYNLPDNLTGADIYAICSNAWLAAVRRHLKNDDPKLNPIGGNPDNDDRDKISTVIVTEDDFIHAARNVVPSVSKEELKRYEKLKAELG